MLFVVALYFGHTIKPGTQEHGTTEHGTPAEQRNTTRTPEHGTPEQGTPAERRNNSRITEHHRNNGTPPERWKHR